jgi:hypothetical protein
LPDIQIDARPGTADRPTEVTVGLRLLNVTAIQDTTQSITADFIISQIWTDPRLAAFEGCQFGLDEIWTPQIDIINTGRLFSRLRKQVDVFEPGRVRYSLVFKYDAHQFPFDHHDIVITLLSVEYGENDVQLIIDEDFTGRKPDEFDVPDWKISQVQAKIIPQYLAAFRQTNSEFAYSISAKKRSDYYIWKVILPLILIVLMSWTVFWINPAQFGPQIGMSATSMLTLIAFQFAMANILPRLSYYTLLDKFIAGSTILLGAIAPLAEFLKQTTTRRTCFDNGAKWESDTFCHSTISSMYLFPAFPEAALKIVRIAWAVLPCLPMTFPISARATLTSSTDV